MSFTFITHKVMGKLSQAAQRTLRRVNTRREELALELAALAEEEEAVLVKATARLRIDTDGPFRGLSIGPGGEVTAVYCSCAPCQALLNNTTVAAATEALIDLGEIHGDMVPLMRARAAEVDKRRGTLIIH